jgi:hypothetical protein
MEILWWGFWAVVAAIAIGVLGFAAWMATRA